MSFVLEDDIDMVISEIKAKNRNSINMQTTYGMKWDKKTGMPINTGTAAMHVSMVQNLSYPAETNAIQQIFSPPPLRMPPFQER